ncbi:MAG: hydantoinase/oxoprolinase family protein [Mesorhizobium sp.]|nr:hydantoinase/oxoprolinase family protein [Mesorhizobium sp.]MCO5162715.1 hydantoinase/oxoprolinase family protein [Mesorhizobium sp.]
MKFHVGTDVGGTFTDLWVASDDGRSRVFKSPTTKDVFGGVMDAIRLAAEAYGLSLEQFCSGIERFGHGTTVGLNALLTGNAAKTAIITTRGFADTLEIGRMRRQTSGLNEIELTNPYLRNRHPPLVARSMIREVDERIDANGNVVIPLDEAGARKILADLRDEGVEAVAVCTLFATVNPVHELRLRSLLTEELPNVFVSLSHDISPTIGEYARMSTTAANAALGPIAGRYLSRLESELRAAGMPVPVLMMTCNGGVLPTEVLTDRPAIALFSGPAAGVKGTEAMGRTMGLGNMLTTDIGGTSFDVGVIVAGAPVMRSEISISGADIRVHSVDVDSIGAGGGSIARAEGGELRVGPGSAGSTPGPACYGRGGILPTATDADLVLGVLDPDNFLGGRMRLDVEAARRAIHDHVAVPLGLGLMEAAWGIRKVLDSKMADLLRRMTVERGHNPQEFTLFANGGAGPSHAWVLAAELGLKGFVVPAAATAQSAYGTGNADLGFSTERPTYVRVAPGDQPTTDQIESVNASIAQAVAETRRNLLLASPDRDVAIELVAAIRFRGQTNHLDVPLSGQTLDQDGFSDLTARFEALYEQLFGRGSSYSSAGFELLSIRAAGSCSLPPPARGSLGDPITRAGSRKVVFDDPSAALDTAIYKTVFPNPGASVAGPCIVEFPGQSVVVPPGAKAVADVFGNLVVGTN